MGRIPILEYKGEFIRETHVIYELLEDLHPEAPNLLPKDPMVRARVREVSLNDRFVSRSISKTFVSTCVFWCRET
jgi:glutathione S-transferase